MELPIDPIILMKRAEIPGLISQLSYLDEKKAIEFIRVWGEKKTPITVLHGTLESELEKG